MLRLGDAHPLHQLAAGGRTGAPQEAAQGVPGHPHHHRAAEAGPRPVRVRGEWPVSQSDAQHDQWSQLFISITCCNPI